MCERPLPSFGIRFLWWPEAAKRRHETERHVVGQFEENRPSGAKAHDCLAGLMYGLKPVPFKLHHCQFMYGLMSVPFKLHHCRFMYGLKPVPFKLHHCRAICSLNKKPLCTRLVRNLLAERADIGGSAACRRNVALERVIHYHAVGVEAPAERTYGPFHALDPAPR